MRVIFVADIRGANNSEIACLAKDCRTLCGQQVAWMSRDLPAAWPSVCLSAVLSGGTELCIYAE